MAGGRRGGWWIILNIWIFGVNGPTYMAGMYSVGVAGMWVGSSKLALRGAFMASKDAILELDKANNGIKKINKEIK